MIRSKLLAWACHLGFVLRDHDLVGAQRLDLGDLVRRGGEGDGVRAQGVRKLHAHMAQAADADDADFLAGTGAPMPQGRPGGDAGAEQRRGAGQVFFRVIDVQDEMLVHGDGGAVAAKGVGAAADGPVIGAGEADRPVADTAPALRLHWAQVRQLSTMQPTPTIWPGLKRVTSLPTAVTLPMISCPGTEGNCDPGHSPRAVCRSLWQTPQ